MSNIKWFIFAGVSVAIIALVVIFSKPNTVDVSSVDQNVILDTDHVYGNRDAKVVIVEYGDFQCPGCGRAHPNVKTVTEKYQNDVAFVFRNLPLTSIHPNALAAASAAEAASKQNKYWEMHNRIYETQSSWESATSDQRNSIFEGYAGDLGLNVDQFKSDVASESVSQKIAKDRALAAKAKATSTPTFVINGQTLNDTSWGEEATFETTVTNALKNVGVTPTPVTTAQNPGGNE